MRIHPILSVQEFLLETQTQRGRSNLAELLLSFFLLIFTPTIYALFLGPPATATSCGHHLRPPPTPITYCNCRLAKKPTLCRFHFLSNVQLLVCQGRPKERKSTTSPACHIRQEWLSHAIFAFPQKSKPGKISRFLHHRAHPKNHKYSHLCVFALSRLIGIN